MPALSVRNLTMTFIERNLFTNVSFDVEERDKVGFIGANGVGKTTLFKILNGEISPVSGTVTFSKNVRDIWNSMPATIRGQMCITSCFPYSTVFRIWKPKFPHLHIRLTKSREILTSLLKGRPCLLNSLKEQAV